MRHTKFVGLAAALAMLSFCSVATAQEVQELANDWTEAYNSANAAALGALYAEDAKLFLHGSPSVSGRDAIQDYWADDMQVDNPLTVLTVTHSVDGFDMKLVHGNYQVLNRNTGVPLGQGRFAHIWTRDGNEWHLDRDMWSEAFNPYPGQ